VMDMDLWLSAAAPGARIVHRFFAKAQFPWLELVGDGDQAVREGLARLNQKIAGMEGLPLLEVVKVRVAKPDTPGSPLSLTQTSEIRESMAQLAVIRQQGGPEAAVAAQAMARMTAMTDPGSIAGASSPLFEITLESSGFSTASVPKAAFAVPEGYRRAD